MTSEYYGSEALPTWYQPHQRFNPIDGMPGGMYGEMFGVKMSNMAQAYGMQPYGYSFAGNPMTSLHAQRLSQQHSSMLHSLAATDQTAYTRMIMGGLKAAGFDTSGGVSDNVARSVGMLHGILPDDLLAAVGDITTGGRSAYALGHGVFGAGRSMYDPVTGFKGVSGDSSMAISQNLFNHFYGPKADPRASAGVGSRDMGVLYNALSQRGLLSTREPRNAAITGALDALAASDSTAFSGAMTAAGIDPGTLSRDANGNYQFSLEQQNSLSSNSAVQRVMRNRSANRMKEQLEGYAGAVSAVRELFGDAGNPNAPMEQLFASLEILTSNTLHQMSPTEAKRRVQSLRVAAESANVGLPALEAMHTYSGQLTQQLGLNPQFSLNATMQGLSMREYMEFGGGTPTTPAWGLATAAQQGMRAQQRAAAAAASPGANRLGLLMRLGSMGVLTGEAAAIADDIRAGGVDPSVMRMSDSEFANMIARNNSGDLSAGRIGTMIRQRSVNEEFVHREGIDSVVFEAQRDDMMRFILGGDTNSAFARRARSQMRDKMGTVDNAAAARMAQAAGRSLMSMSNNDRADRGRRNNIMASAMYASLEGTAAGDAYLRTLGSNRDERIAALELNAEDMYGEGEKDFRRLRGDPTAYMINDLNAMSPESEKARRVEKEAMALRVKAMDAMLGRTDPNVARRVMRAIGREADYDPKDANSLTRIFGAALGADETVEVLGRLTPLMTEIDALEKKKETRGLSAAEAKDLEAKREAAASEGTKLREIIERYEKDSGGEGDAVSADASSAGAKGGGPSSISLYASTISLMGTPVMTDGKSGSVAVHGKPRGAPANAGMA